MRVEMTVTTGPAKGRRFTFDKPESFLFGRTNAHVSFPDDQHVSRRHCLLEISPTECILKDLNSKNGVVVNGIRYGGRTPPKAGVTQAPMGMNEVRLKDGDEITVGNTCIKVSIQSDSWVNEAHEEFEQIVGDVLTDPKSRFEDTSSPRVPRIGGYCIEQEIKYEGIETVYRAKEINTGRSVTIKTLLLQGSIDPYRIHIFQRELNIIRQINHQHIVRFLGYGKTSELLYLIFEFVEGTDLAQFIRSRGGRVSIHEALPLWFGILDGLAYAHHAKITLQDVNGKSKTFEGVVHRNLKPQNILLARKGNSWIPQITDFGLMKCFEAAGLTDITTQGDVFGTPVYWPREQITHYKYLCPATDVFSIAAVFYEMLTGAWVREGFRDLAARCKQLGRPPTISDYMNVITANPLIPIRQRNPNIPEPLAQVLDRALREEDVPSDPTKMQEVLKKLRYADAGVFRDTLRNALKDIRELKSPTRPSFNAQDRYHAQSKEDVGGKKGEVKRPLDSTATSPDSQPSVSREVALLTFDLVQSTQYILDAGDTSFTVLIGIIFRKIKTHSSSSDLICLKGTGDGFLAVFRTMSAALSLALTFLEAPIHPKVPIRMALHWGAVKISSNEDVFGMAVYKVSQIEKITIQDSMSPTASGKTLPDVNRILVTKEGREQFDDLDKARFRPIGKFRPKGFDELFELWILHK
jgi:serine/threonine protein kinase